MRRILLATTILFSASLAHAADMEYKAPMPRVAPAVVFSWTGFYLGANAGLGGDKIDYPFDILGNRVTGNLSTQSFGGFAGGQVGYNYQFAGGVVAGLEADIQWSNIRSHLGANASFGNNAFGLDAGTEVKWFGTARARLGYAVIPQMLLYATGGYAYGSETTSLGVTGIGNGFAFGRTANLSGYVVGGGIEYALSSNWSAKTEYLFYDFGKRNVFASPNNAFSINNDIQMHTLKFGVNYSFR